MCAKEQGRQNVFFIAEAGVNHNGEKRLAKKLINIAAACGADAVKFQTFRTERIISGDAPKAQYQKVGCSRESQFDMLKRLELSSSDFKELARHCKKKRILFLSTPDDAESVGLLAQLRMPIYKIASGEVTNLPHLRKIGSMRKRVILSTGMATMEEVENAMKVLVRSGTRRQNIVLLHCTTEYPAPYAEVNLRAMVAMKEKFGVDVGYSDHTSGIDIPIAAVALGASVVEKHFTIDKALPGPDHRASASPEELAELIRCIRHVEEALGSGIKRPSACELKNIDVVRRSIFAARHIRRGEILSEENLITKRPGTGISPMEWDHVVGTRAKRDFLNDAMIEL